MTAFCYWCLTKIKAPPNHDPRKQSLFCSHKCYTAEFMFRQWQSDDAIKRRTQWYIDSQQPNSDGEKRNDGS